MTTDRVVPFTAGDGFQCNLIHVTGSRTPDKGPVLLVPGAGVRANIYRPPVKTTFVDYLLEEGYDVWLENWRASMDLTPNEWTLDQAARYDHPAAVQTMLRESGARTAKAVIHCQGSTSFMISAVSGLVPEITNIVSNAVSLHPIVPHLSMLKLRYAVPVVSRMTPYLDAQWGRKAPGVVPKLIYGFVALMHHECNNPVCKMSSFSYGSGWPTLWSHEQLNPAIHDWISGEFGKVPMTFFKQIGLGLESGHLTSADAERDYTAEPPKTDARFAFVAGLRNRCFVWESQQRTYDYFNALRPNFHSLQLIADYGHLDVFIGKDAARDTFPIMAAELAH